METNNTSVSTHKSLLHSRIIQVFIVTAIVYFLLGVVVGYNLQPKSIATANKANSKRSLSSPTPTFIFSGQKSYPTPITKAPPSRDINNIFSSDVPIKYSFQYLEGYKVIWLHGFNYRIIQAAVNEENSEEHLEALKDPESMDVMFINYYDGAIKDKSTNITKEDIHDWMKTSGWTAAQCVTERRVSEIIINEKLLYKVDVICGGINKTSFLYLLEIDRDNGDFVLISANPPGEQFNLFLKTFTVSK